MKVVHVLKRIEMLDNDIKELKKLEKSIASNKSFSTPIFMSIEKQINILLGERIKMLELKIANPPEQMVEEIEGKTEPAPAKSEASPVAEARRKPVKSAVKKSPAPIGDDTDDDDIPMLTQDQIDKKFAAIQGSTPSRAQSEPSKSSDSVKILDEVLEKGRLDKGKDKEKKVKFFRENFPVDTY